MFIASNGSPDSAQTAGLNHNEQIIDEEVNPLTVDAAPTHDSSDLLAATDGIDEISIESEQHQDNTNSPSLSDRIKLFFSSPGKDNNDNIQMDDADFDITAAETPLEPQNKISAIAQKENTITALLNLAKLQMENKKLTSPASDNSLDTYRMVLQLDPNNKEAAAGVESIRVRYLIWAEQQAVAGNSGKAKLYLELAKEMSTDSN